MKDTVTKGDIEKKLVMLNRILGKENIPQLELDYLMYYGYKLVNAEKGNDETPRMSNRNMMAYTEGMIKALLIIKENLNAR